MKPTQEIPNEDKKIPTEADMIKALKAQMPLKRLQVELQELNTRFVTLKVAEFDAISKLQQIEAGQREAQAKQDQFMMENIIKHKVTQEDLDMNPEMVGAGISVGNEIGIPKEIYKDLNLANKVDTEKVEEKLEEVREEVKSPLSVVKD